MVYRIGALSVYAVRGIRSKTEIAQNTQNAF